ncbi:MAG: hypothetical protein HQ569_02325 [Actinobacteria bacterium]|nr:hypothetical protein [Actinomycetota bacterium]
MIKKIIIGIIITAVLSLGAAGSIYAYRIEQPKLNTAVLTTNDKNDSSVSSVENKYQYDNAYGKTEKNGNCETENNCYSWQYNYNHENKNCNEDNCFNYNYNYEHNYNYQDANGECGGDTSRNQNRTSNENNGYKNIKNNGR